MGIRDGHEDGGEITNRVGLHFAADDGVHARELWSLDSAPQLLRDTKLTRIDPLDTPLDDLLPLDPLSDLYLTDFLPGGLDPDDRLLDDPLRPLAFYQLAGPGTLQLAKASGRIRIYF